MKTENPAYYLIQKEIFNGKSLLENTDNTGENTRTKRMTAKLNRYLEPKRNLLQIALNRHAKAQPKGEISNLGLRDITKRVDPSF